MATLSKWQAEDLQRALDRLRNAGTIAEAQTAERMAREPDSGGLRWAYKCGAIESITAIALSTIERTIARLQEPSDADVIVAGVQTGCGLPDGNPGRIAGLGCYWPASGRDSERRDDQDVLTWLDWVAAESAELSERWVAEQERKAVAELAERLPAAVADLGDAVDELVAGCETAPHEDVSEAGHLEPAAAGGAS